ncbi:hypothetical protein [Marmoricola endophyticus]|uniref:hypothetical protein n=1 Tax=Marmoricola endophyticus TaxID=2040280 RepID=UPI00166DEF2E|nr:hypothetical protein [Marmoricola endophyticus]
MDAFVRSSRRVCELVERSLSDRHIVTPHSEVRLHAARSEDDRVLVKINGTRDEGWDSATVLVPDAVADLSAQERGVLVLNVADKVITALADLRGWENVEQLSGIRDDALSHNLRYTQVGPWKTNRSRKLRARPVAEIADDGLTRLHYEVADARTGEDIGVTRSTWVMENRRLRLQRLFEASRWQGPGRIAVRRHEFYGQGQWSESVREFDVDEATPAPTPADPSEPAQLTPLSEDATARSNLDVEVVTWWGEGTDEPKVMSGGFTSDTPGDYSEYQAAYFVVTTWINQHCARWWAAAEPNVLHLYLGVSDYYRTGRSVRLNGDKVTATARRRPEDLHGNHRDRALAREDLAALLARIATRLGLPAPPDLPDPEVVATEIDQIVRRQLDARHHDERWLNEVPE